MKTMLMDLVGGMRSTECRSSSLLPSPFCFCVFVCQQDNSDISRRILMTFLARWDV